MSANAERLSAAIETLHDDVPAGVQRLRDLVTEMGLGEIIAVGVTLSQPPAILLRISEAYVARHVVDLRYPWRGMPWQIFADPSEIDAEEIADLSLACRQVDTWMDSE